MRKLLLLFCYLCFSQISCQNGTEIDKTFELLAQGEKQIELTNETEVVLVFGATGSGKSTFIQWMTGDNKNLVSKETFPDSGEYLIEDTNNKIGSSSVSKTLFPECVTDGVTATTFYDFPGFSDTRSSSHDIAASFFMKTVMDHVDNVKMLFTTSYYTVQEGMDRTGFPALLKNIDDLIGDVDKFKDSIALVVSKVDNIYIKQKGRYILKPDSTVIKGIANFLMKIREDFEDDLKRTDISDKKRKYSANAIKIINILLTQEDGEYTHITLFRRPDQEGLLSESELLLEGKEIVQHMIAENLRFSHTDTDDFGFTIADNSKLEIDSIVSVINDQITGSIDAEAADIKRKLESFVEPVRVEIEAGNIGALNLTQARKFSAQVYNDQSILSEAVKYFNELNALGDVSETLETYLTGLSIEMPKTLEENMSKFARYFEFFQLFRENLLPVSSLSWAKSFQFALSYLTESQQFISDRASSLSEEINSRITSEVDFIADKVKQNFADDVDRMAKIVKSLTDNTTSIIVDPMEAQAFHTKLAKGEKFLAQLVETAKALSKPQTLSDEISEALSSMRFELPHEELSNIDARSQEFEILEVVSGTNFSFPAAQWSNAFKTVVTYIQTQNILTLAAHAQEAIGANVDSLLKTVTEKLRSYVEKKILELEVTDVNGELEKWHPEFSLICNKFNEATTLESLARDCALSLLELNVNEIMIHAKIGSLKEEEIYIGFLRSLKGESTEIVATQAWKAYIEDFKKFLEVELGFNAFVSALFETLSQFDVQKDVSRYDVLDLSHWGESGHPQGLHVDKSNFELFMEKVKVTMFLKLR